MHVVDTNGIWAYIEYLEKRILALENEIKTIKATK